MKMLFAVAFVFAVTGADIPLQEAGQTHAPVTQEEVCIVEIVVAVNSNQGAN